MRILLALALCASLAGQTPLALDIVLLVEDSIPVTNFVSRTDLNNIRPGDRLAVMTFSNKQSLKLPLEGDFGKQFRAVHKLDSKGALSTTRLWDAVAKATELFDGPRDPSRRRVIFLAFSAEDKASVQTLDTVRAALGRSEAALSAATIWRSAPASRIPRISQVPNRTPAPRTPDVLGENTPVSQGSALNASLVSVEGLVMETGGLLQKNEWNFTKLAEYARNH